MWLGGMALLPLVICPPASGMLGLLLLIEPSPPSPHHHPHIGVVGGWQLVVFGVCVYLFNTGHNVRVFVKRRAGLIPAP